MNRQVSFFNGQSVFAFAVAKDDDDDDDNGRAFLKHAVYKKITSLD